MDPLTFEAVTRDPDLMRALIARAHRERAREFHRLVVEPIKSLFKSLFTLGNHHASGSDLAAARKG